jgi:hypothetical protein
MHGEAVLTADRPPEAAKSIGEFVGPGPRHK